MYYHHQYINVGVVIASNQDVRMSEVVIMLEKKILNVQMYILIGIIDGGIARYILILKSQCIATGV